MKTYQLQEIDGNGAVTNVFPAAVVSPNGALLVRVTAPITDADWSRLKHEIRAFFAGQPRICLARGDAVEFVSMNMGPIPVTERLPEATPRYSGTEHAVLAYDTHLGWVGAMYREDGRWELEAAGVSGYEWERARLLDVTHWMPYPPAPEHAE